ncbi:hemicentin-1-like isoform X2 [Dreissena polymorpha]|uniref:hemicentin-1-like isoform X2 n=1 Tax=Dreissena polymorpha TaxID=45954 RepID=UPI002263F44F|nr:hemicentin-1-like isoform X2 [Dreissena polymorpha]
MQKLKAQSLQLLVDNASVLENTSVTLTCILPSKPTQLSWWRNGSSSGMWTWMDDETCHSSPTPLPGLSFSCINNTVYTLTLNHVHRSQDGETWNCAVNYIGTTMTPSNNITLSILVHIKKLTISPSNDILYLILNQPHNISCTSDFGIPSPSISWLKHLSTSDTTYDIDMTGFSSAKTLNHITISTLNFVPSKSDHNMGLSCKGNNGGLIISSEAKLINVLEGPATPEIVFNGSTVSRTLNITSGQSLTLICKSSSNPPPTFSWRHPSGSATGAILTITSIQPYHDGAFTCTAQNTLLSSTGKIISEQSTSAVNVVVFVPITCVSVVGEHVDVVVMKEHETKYFT